VTVIYCGTERPTKALLQNKKIIFNHEGDGNLRDMSWNLCPSVTALRMTKMEGYVVELVSVSYCSEDDENHETIKAFYLPTDSQ